MVLLIKKPLFIKVSKTYENLTTERFIYLIFAIDYQYPLGVFVKLRNEVKIEWTKK